MAGYTYRICKQFEVENGHMLAKHPSRCRFPHGHSRKIEIVIESRELDANDMVVDFKAVRLAVEAFLDRYDHALCVNVDDPLYEALVACYGGPEGRLIPYRGEDPTSEVMAREMYEFVAAKLSGGGVVVAEDGSEYPLPPGLKVRSLRLWETTSSWAEIVAD